MRIRILLYNLILAVAVLLALPWIIYKLAFVKKRRQGLGQRLGRLKSTGRRTLWCHAVSVGEVRAISPLLKLLQGDERISDRIVLSTVTDTGQETAHRECGFVSSIIYFPLDLPFVVGHALRRIDPEIFITSETEIWPNFFNACFRHGIPIVIVNGRISDTSFPRYMKFRWFFRPVLQNVTLFLMQSDEDARRIIELGAGLESVQVTGNMKYDRIPSRVKLPQKVEKWAGSGFLLVAGSTHAGEEKIILDAFDRMPDRELKVALVPRHPGRFDEVAGILDERGCSYNRFSDIDEGFRIERDILLVDAMGLLDEFYALSDAAFVGGSLVPIGGHNLLEPAIHGVPVITGPNTHNFKEITRALIAGDGCRVVHTVDDLESTLEEFIGSEESRQRTGRAAMAVSRGTIGASEQNCNIIKDLLQS